MHPGEIVGCDVVTAPTFAGEVSSAVVMLPPEWVTSIQHIGPRHAFVRVLHSDDGHATTPLRHVLGKRRTRRNDDAACPAHQVCAYFMTRTASLFNTQPPTRRLM